MIGYIKLHRKIMESQYGMHPELFHFFVCLVMMANHKEGYTEDGTKILPGQFMTSQLKLSVKFKISRSKAQRFLEKLKIAQQIDADGSNKNTIITILNWDTYQGDDAQIDEQAMSKRSTGGPQAGTNKNAKNVNKEKNKEFISPFVELFDGSPEIQDWLNTGILKTHNDLLAKYDINYLKRQIENCYLWKVENKKPYKAGVNLKQWLERDKYPCLKANAANDSKEDQERIDFAREFYKRKFGHYPDEVEIRAEA